MSLYLIEVNLFDDEIDHKKMDIWKKYFSKDASIFLKKRDSPQEHYESTKHYLQ